MSVTYVVFENEVVSGEETVVKLTAVLVVRAATDVVCTVAAV